MKAEVDVALLVGSRKATLQKIQADSCTFNDLSPGETGVKFLNQVTASTTNPLNMSVGVELKRSAPVEATVIDKVVIRERFEAASQLVSDVSWSL
jgi:hypothetical protein